MTQQDYKPTNDKAEPRPKVKKNKVSAWSRFKAFKSRLWQSIVENWHYAMYVSHQLAKLVTAASLLTVSAVSFWYAYNHSFAVAGAKQWVMFAGILIGLLGAGQFLKTLGKK